MGHLEDLLAIVKKRKLRWYGHVARSEGPSKMILQGTVQGKKMQGRQKKYDAENIADWIGKNFATSVALALNHQRWRQLVQGSVLQCPNDPEKG